MYLTRIALVRILPLEDRKKFPVAKPASRSSRSSSAKIVFAEYGKSLLPHQICRKIKTAANRFSLVLF
ncbi:hypothetical protein CH378_03650 [Leptospira kmetyi]|uniref:Uncharacterized protein n=1 Tax=Leptospira kmetyi TaxID=408139 RepID=A0ABX4ND58_9LEPT|nr:hypothetical protein CH378_03650 [Leptospira kmetyi]